MLNATMNRDRAKGALWGALVGDAAGAYLEFLGRSPTQTEVDRAIQMPGGGCWDVAPGQITDDGEMTIALARALIDTRHFNLNSVARSYRAWCLSRPFDIGIATHNALGQGDLEDPEIADICLGRARLRNHASKANGCLMRATPLAVWGCNQDIPSLVNAAKADCQLTHPNPTCQVATAAYVVAIRHLILNSDDHHGAFASAEAVVAAECNEEVLGFLANAKAGTLPAFYPQAGFVGIGFTHAFHHLWQQSTYLDAIKTVLAGGGDTDTNACIVGGLIGAREGVGKIPETMLEAVQKCDVREGRNRPAWLQTRGFEEVVSQLFAGLN